MSTNFNITESAQESIIDIILNVVTIGAFLACFYFLYVAQVEKGVVVGQIQYVVDSLYGTAGAFLPAEAKANLVTSINQYVNSPQFAQSFAAQDAATNENNAKIKKQTYLLMIGLFIIVWGIVLYYWYYVKNRGFNMMRITISVIVCLIVVAFVEFAFLKLFASKYYSVDANNVKKQIITSINNYNGKSYNSSNISNLPLTNARIEALNKLEEGITEYKKEVGQVQQEFLTTAEHNLYIDPQKYIKGNPYVNKYGSDLYRDIDSSFYNK